MAGRAAGSGANGSEEEFAAAHRELRADDSIQFDLPQIEPREPSRSLGWLAEFLQAIWPGLQVLFWIALAAIILFLLYVIGRRIMGAELRWRRRGDEGEKRLDLRPAAGVARQLLSEADALAAEGRYSEASRLLLFRSIEDIDSRRPNILRPALTSRDIASLHQIPPAPRSAFSRLVLAVERSLFGRRALAADDWRSCRAAYEEFAFAESWRG